MDKNEYNRYKWLDAQEHQSRDNVVQNKGQEQRMLNKVMDFFNVDV